MGGSETDLLREVTYNGVENGNKIVKNTNEPQNLQFLPLRKKIRYCGNRNQRSRWNSNQVFGLYG